VVIKQELREREEALAQELVGKIHGRVHDARAVRADGIGHMLDVDGVQEFVI
jgi:hypothetical protein